MRNIIIPTIPVCATACLLTFMAGCQTKDQGSPQPAVQPAQPAQPAATPPARTAVAPATAASKGVVRIKAGQSTPFTDSSGNVWQAEQGFEGGQTVDRDPGTAIANTKDPGLYLTEHYSMDSFSCATSSCVNCRAGRGWAESQLSSTERFSESQRITERSMTFCNSRMLPGQE